MCVCVYVWAFITTANAVAYACCLLAVVTFIVSIYTHTHTRIGVNLAMHVCAIRLVDSFARLAHPFNICAAKTKLPRFASSDKWQSKRVYACMHVDTLSLKRIAKLFTQHTNTHTLVNKVWSHHFIINFSMLSHQANIIHFIRHLLHIWWTLMFVLCTLSPPCFYIMPVGYTLVRYVTYTHYFFQPLEMSLNSVKVCGLFCYYPFSIK